MRNFKKNLRYGGGFKLVPKPAPVKIPQCNDLGKFMENMAGIIRESKAIKLPEGHIAHITDFTANLYGEDKLYSEEDIVCRRWEPDNDGRGGYLVIWTTDDVIYKFMITGNKVYMPMTVIQATVVPVKYVRLAIKVYKYKDKFVYWKLGEDSISLIQDPFVIMTEQFYRPSKDPNCVELVTRSPAGYVIFSVNNNCGIVKSFDVSGEPADVTHIHLTTMAVMHSSRIIPGYRPNVLTDAASGPRD